ncbi:proton channel OtopLc-like [Ischnura elegans]|uniref:proton channel OtopLc-like n=1 Tax=Ischnura elegans TaxID=197161 RepID=UPI001ED87744|nr:proton channel OtopLc-like [Ischnura elegans]
MVADVHPGAVVGRRHAMVSSGGGAHHIPRAPPPGYGERHLPRWLQVATYSHTHHHHIMPTPVPSTDLPPEQAEASWDPTGLLSRPNPHYMQHPAPQHASRHQLGPVDRKSKRDQPPAYMDPPGGVIYMLKDEELVEEGAEEEKVVIEEMEMAVDVARRADDWDDWKSQETLRATTTLASTKPGKSEKEPCPKGPNKPARRISAEKDSLNGSPSLGAEEGAKSSKGNSPSRSSGSSSNKKKEQAAAASEALSPPAPGAGGEGPDKKEGEKALGGRKSCAGLSLKTFLGVLSGTMGRGFGDIAEQKEPFWHLWILLSSIYGILLVILMMVFCVTEVMDNNIELLNFQGAYLLYLYVGSISVIICIYIWVLIDSCSSMSATQSSRSLHLGYPPDSELPSGLGLDSKHISSATANDLDISDAELNPNVRWRDTEIGTLSRRFGSLKKAHISRSATSTTSFYLRVGALVFGLGTLVYNGLEMAMHSMMDGQCLSDIVFIHPVLNGLFTFLQMHFLFVNSQVVVERFGLAARFGFMHLVGTNLALWVRLIVWETGLEWTYYLHLVQGGFVEDYSLLSDGLEPNGAASPTPRMLPTPLELKGFPKSMMSRVTRDVAPPMAALLVGRQMNASNALSHHDVYHPVSDGHINQVVALHRCLNTNSLGQLWTSSMPFLFPFLVEFSLIAAAVMFVMAQKVGQGKKLVAEIKCKAGLGLSGCTKSKRSSDCHGASKGLFLGLLCLVSGIVVTIVFFVVKDNEQFSPLLAFWLCSGTRISILALCTLLTAVGLVQIRRLSLVTACSRHRGPLPTLDRILLHTSLTGVLIHSVFGMVAGGSKLMDGDARYISVFISGAFLLVQAATQSALLSEALHRICVSRLQLTMRPGRQVITFLLFANAILWVFDAFVTHSWVAQEVQLHFYGVLVWGVVSRISLPLLVFYRFHSVVLLLEVWKRSYGTSGIY